MEKSMSQFIIKLLFFNVLLILLIITTNAQQVPISTKIEKKSVNMQYRSELDSLVLEGVRLINSNKLEEAISLFNKALAINDTLWHIHYEKALAYYQMKQFDSVIKILKPFLNRPDLNSQFYEILGASYDIKNNLEQAENIYDRGLEKFPNAANLYMQYGMHFIQLEEFVRAMAMWEKGVEVDPMYENNYFMLSKYYFHTGEYVWTNLYGEIFLNLSDKAGLLEDISKFIYRAYNNGCYNQIDSLTIETSFTKTRIQSKNLKGRNDLPFEVAYDLVMNEAVKGIIPKDKTELTIDQLYKIRKNFIEIWYKEGWNKRFSNALFDLHKKLIKNGHFEAYNYWVFNAACKVEANNWLKNNKEKLETMGNFMVKNKFKLNKANYINRPKFTRSY